MKHQAHTEKVWGKIFCKKLYSWLKTHSFFSLEENGGTVTSERQWTLNAKSGWRQTDIVTERFWSSRLESAGCLTLRSIEQSIRSAVRFLGYVLLTVYTVRSAQLLLLLPSLETVSKVSSYLWTPVLSVLYLLLQGPPMLLSIRELQGCTSS